MQPLLQLLPSIKIRCLANNTETCYIAQALSWLNGRRWEDEPGPDDNGKHIPSNSHNARRSQTGTAMPATLKVMRKNQ